MKITNYLLDTNALSEASKKTPDVGFMDWFRDIDDMILFTSCLVIGEIKKGIELSDDTGKHEKLAVLFNEITATFGDRIVDIDKEVATLWGKFMAKGQKSGKTPPVIDMLIAAQCIAHDLVLVTRNVKDFEQFVELEIFSPWSK